MTARADAVLCKGCGNVISSGLDPCPYCDQFYVTEVGAVPVKEVPHDCPRWFLQHAVLDELMRRHVSTFGAFCTNGRLATYRISQAAAFLARRLATSDQGVQGMRFHLWVPVLLYPHVLSILESVKVAERSDNARNVVHHFLACVWVDSLYSEEFIVPNLPWFMFSTAEAMLGPDVDLDSMYYGNGTMP